MYDKARTYLHFSLQYFLNDLENFLSQSNIKGVELEDNIFHYLKIFFVLYADDTVIFSESSQDLQEALDLYASYCRIWKCWRLITQKKVVDFSKGRMPNYNFNFNGCPLEVAKEYKYLGFSLVQVVRSWP